MTTRVSINTIFHGSLERVFRTPMLCDITKVHTGYGIMPKVTHTTDDYNWGKPGQSKKVFVTKSLTQKGGWASMDKVLERRENEYWKIEVSQFQSTMLGFTKFVGEWTTWEIGEGEVKVQYSYTLHSRFILLYPLNWLFAKTFWKPYMKRVIENIRKLIDNKEPYQYP